MFRKIRSFLTEMSTKIKNRFSRQKQDNPFAFLRQAHQANRSASNSAILDEKQDENLNEIKEIIQYYESIGARNRMLVIMAILSCLAWAFITAVEYFVSSPIYAVILYTTANDITPILMAIAFSLFAVFLSGAIGELIFPIFSNKARYLIPSSNSEKTPNLKNKGIDKRYMWFGFGLLATFATAALLYAISQERVVLEAEVYGSYAGNISQAEILVPSVLFLMEVITGIFLPFTICTFYCRFRMKSLKRQRDRLIEQNSFFGNRALEYLDECSRRLEHYNRRHSDNPESQIMLTRELRQLIEKRLEIRSSPSSANADAHENLNSYHNRNSDNNETTINPQFQENDSESQDIPPDSVYESNDLDDLTL